VRTSCGTERGFAGGSISAIAQTTDGYLWTGTENGLVRFDGLNFRHFGQASPSSFAIGGVQSLLADEQSNLWVLLRSTKLLHYRDGSFELVRGEAENGVTAIGFGVGNSWRTYTARDGLSAPDVNCLLRDSNGVLWIGTAEGLAFLSGDYIASNGDGLWNGSEAMLGFEVEPSLWQTWWFRLACVLCAGLATLLVYRMRMHRLTQLLNVRFEERLAERTRIAQELHDTLLQGVLSASMQLHVAVDQLPEDSPARPSLNHVLELMGRVVNEGRNTLRGLRSSIDRADDLRGSFSRIPQELGRQEEIDFRVVVDGASKPLRSVIRDDIYGIGREALVNAFRHSRARSIDVQLEYAPNQLRVVVRDDGCGIDPELLETGRDGHWGLSGMRERAERIGAKLKVLSCTGGGTEVELRVPGNVAFGPHPSSRASKWLTGFHRPQKEDELTPK